MPTKAVAWILSFLSIFALKSPFQPNNIPETRSAPYGDSLPDKYSVWPTKDFETANAPFWICTNSLKRLHMTYDSITGTKLDGFLVLHKGKLIHEEYWNDYAKDTPHEVFSITKSVLSALTGIAISEGLIGGVDDKAADYFPEARNSPAWQESKAGMTIEHLLTMTSGIVADTDEPWDGLTAPDQSDSALYAFLQPQRYAPDTKFVYDNMAPQILMGILARASGRDMLEYAREKLFAPLGMRSVTWETAPDGLPFGGFGISMTPRDMARFGYLYLNYGRWENKQIIPADWVAISPPKVSGRGAYGYMFWNPRVAPFSLFGMYEANGHAEQRIVIMPKFDLVIVCTAQKK